MVPDYVLTDHMLKSVEHCLELHKIRTFTGMLSHSMFVTSYHQVRSGGIVFNKLQIARMDFQCDHL